mmetsp:Transcript_18544/g.43606  ORF Transcript_18544/g.43606 Transcript_18544/m.43606 type:complete len:112 (-) Transcript_18544:24-359(-)
MPVGPAAAAISLGFQMTCCWHFHVVKQTHEVAAEASFAELHHLQILSALLFERWQGCFASVSLHAVRSLWHKCHHGGRLGRSCRHQAPLARDASSVSKTCERAKTYERWRC